MVTINLILMGTKQNVDEYTHAPCAYMRYRRMRLYEG